MKAKTSSASVCAFSNKVESFDNNISKNFSEMKSLLPEAIENIEVLIEKTKKELKNCENVIQKGKEKLSQLKSLLNSLTSKLSRTPPKIETQQGIIDNPEYIKLQREIEVVKRRISNTERVLSKLDSNKKSIKNQIDEFNTCQSNIVSLNESMSNYYKNIIEVDRTVTEKIKNILKLIQEYLNVNI